MAPRTQRESLLLGIILGTVVGFAFVLPIGLLVELRGAETETTTAPSAESAAPAAANGGAAVAQESSTGRGGGPPEGRGPGSGGGRGAGGGPPAGRGPGSQIDGDRGDPLSEGIASAEVLDAFAAGGCVACHAIKGVGGEGATAGPGLSRLGDVGELRRAGMSTVDYIQESVIDPDAFVRPNCPTGACPSGVMPQTYGETLSESQIATIVEYLAALGTAAEADVLNP